MDINVKVNVPAIEKLIEVSSSGIGAVAGPMLAPWKASRDGKARIESAKADIQISELQEKALLKARKRIEHYDPEAQSGNYLDGYVSERIQFQEQKRLANIKSVTQKTATELEGKLVPDQEPDHDWTAKFFSSIQDVSSEDIQALWAKILAGQIERPGSTSLRTLGVLQEMDRDTAKLFKKFCSMCIFLEFSESELIDGRICSLGKNAGENSLQSFGLGFGKLNQLQEYGLIISDYNSWRVYSLPQIVEEGVSLPFRFQNSFWCLRQIDINTQVQEIKIHGPSLSISGLELSRVVECKPAGEFMQELQGFFQATNLRMIRMKQKQ